MTDHEDTKRSKGREPFAKIKRLNLRSKAEIKDALRRFDSVEKQIVYLEEQSEKIRKAKQIDSLIADSVHEAGKAKSFVAYELERLKEIERYRETQTLREEGGTALAWQCEPDKQERLFQRLTTAGYGKGGTGSKYRWTASLKELAFLCKCLMNEDPRMIPFLLSQGDFRNFAMQFFEWSKGLFKPGSLKQTWKQCPEPDEVAEEFKSEKKKERYETIRAIVREVNAE